MFQCLSHKLKLSSGPFSIETRQRDAKADLRAFFKTWRNDLLPLSHLQAIGPQHNSETLTYGLVLLLKIICNLHAMGESVKYELACTPGQPIL